MKSTRAIILGLALLTVWAAQSNADTVLTVVSSGTGGNSNITYGYQFMVGSTTLEATSLGMFNSGGVSFVNSHDVGLWNSTGTLLGEVTVPSGSPADYSADFAYVSLSSPVTLIAGSTYTVGAFYPSGSDVVPVSSVVTFNPYVSLVGYDFKSGVSLSMPTTSNSNAIPAANILVTAVPEPSTWMLFGLGAVTVGGICYRRSVRTA